MPRPKVLLLACGMLAASGCTGNATPAPRTCPTVAQTAHFTVSGPCGGAGNITITTDPGLCDLNVQGAAAVGLPSTGSFSGTASNTSYKIALGNFTLHRGSSDPYADPSSVTCEATAEDGGSSLSLACDFNDCVPSGEQEGYSCQDTNCTDFLDPM